MKRFISTIIGFLTLVVTSVVVYAVLHTWLETDDGIPVPTSTLRRVTVEQPQMTPWQGSFDNSGYDVSFPQCGQALPSAYVGFVIIGLNDGRPFTGNPCFSQQWSWAKKHDAAAVYINVDDPGASTPSSYGQSIGLDVLARLVDNNIPQGTPVWLDVERNNAWDSATRAVSVINSTMRYLAHAGYPVGVYAAPVHWFEITYDAEVDVPIWFAIGPYPTTQAGVQAAKRACSREGFGSAKPAIVQFVSGAGSDYRDRNIMCTSPTGLVARQK